MKKNFVFGCCSVVLTMFAAACSGSDGLPGSQGSEGAQGATGAQGAAGSDGAQGATGATGAQGAAGSDGAQGAAGAQGVPGDKGEVGATGSQGAQGDAGVSLCGDQSMPEWHTPCGADLVGACASTTLQWQCHLFLTEGQSGDVTESLKKVCADSSTGKVAFVGAAQASEYPANPLAQNSGKCNLDSDCDGKLDLTSGVVGDGESNQPTVSLGDTVTVANATWAGHATACATGTVSCVSGALALTGLVSAAGASNIGSDCFDPTTQLEQTFACHAGTVIVPATSPDGDGDPEDTADLWILQGAASVVCDGPTPL